MLFLNSKCKLAQISKCRSLCNESIFLLQGYVWSVGGFFPFHTWQSLILLTVYHSVWANVLGNNLPLAEVQYTQIPLAHFPRYISDIVQHWFQIQNHVPKLWLYLWRLRQELDTKYHWVQPKTLVFYYLSLHANWQFSRETSQEKLEKIGMKNEDFCLVYALEVSAFKHIFTNYRYTVWLWVNH